MIMLGDKPAIYRLGDSPIYRMYKGDEMLYQQGLQCIYDKRSFSGTYQNGYAYGEINSGEWFVSGFYDSGDATKKQYTVYIVDPVRNFTSTLRFFNDKSAISVDYWAITSGVQRTISSVGRFAVFDLRYHGASKCWLYCNTTGKFLIRGDEAVTPYD